MYKLIGMRASRAFRVLWLLEEIGLPYEHIAAPPHSDEVRALNPSGKIPVLIDEGATLCDSVAIMTYLADKHGQFTAVPGTIPRARQDAKTHQILDEIDAVLWAAARHTFVLPKEHRVAEVKPSLTWEYQRNLARLAKAFEGPFLMGDEMSIPDILLCHCLGWAQAAGFPAPEAPLKGYLKTMRARPAFQAASKL